MNERTELEDRYYKVRNDAIGHMDMFEREKMRAEMAVDQLYKFKNFTDDEIADDLLKMSDQMLNHKLGEQRQKRRKDEAEEQVNYLGRLLDNKTKEVVFIEEKMAKLEKDYTKKEQSWRNADNDRMKNFFNKAPDTIEIKRQKEVVSRIKGENLSMPGGGSIGGFNVSRGPADAMDKLAEEQAGQYNRTIQRLEATLAERDRTIKQLRKWANMVDYVGEEPPPEAFATGGTAKLGDLLEESQAKSKDIYDKETRELAEAAQATIKTLNEMLDQKKKQLDAKELHISNLRNGMADERKKHVESMMRLEKQIQDANRRNADAASRMSTADPGTKTQ